MFRLSLKLPLNCDATKSVVSIDRTLDGIDATRRQMSTRITDSALRYTSGFSDVRLF